MTAQFPAVGLKVSLWGNKECHYPTLYTLKRIINVLLCAWKAL